MVENARPSLDPTGRVRKRHPAARVVMSSGAILRTSSRRQECVRGCAGPSCTWLDCCLGSTRLLPEPAATPTPCRVPTRGLHIPGPLGAFGGGRPQGDAKCWRDEEQDLPGPVLQHPEHPPASPAAPTP